MAFCRPNWLNTCATTATSPSHEGVEGTEVGAIWTWTEGCVILFLCLLSRESSEYWYFPCQEDTVFVSFASISTIYPLPILVTQPRCVSRGWSGSKSKSRPMKADRSSQDNPLAFPLTLSAETTGPEVEGPT